MELTFYYFSEYLAQRSAPVFGKTCGALMLFAIVAPMSAIRFSLEAPIDSVLYKHITFERRKPVTLYQ